MQLNLSGHNLDITPSLRYYVSGKFCKLERHFDQMTSAHVVLTVEKIKQRQKAEATVHVPGGNLVADAVEPDMYAAIDAMVDKLDRQIRKHKDKLTDHQRQESGVKNLVDEEPD